MTDSKVAWKRRCASINGPGDSILSPRVAVAGGGLAGLAAAAVLCETGVRVELFEARRRLGGRATSFRDAGSGALVDHCQHVSMGCCTNLADFCRRMGIQGRFRRDRVLHFFARDGRRCDVTAAWWLPAPLHLAPALLRLGLLSLRERITVARALWKLARTSFADGAGDEPTIGEWLRDQQQSDAAMRRFWSVVLVSALGESLERASASAARKVFVDAFLASRRGYEIEVPRVPLGELYGEEMIRRLTERGVVIHLGRRVRRVATAQDGNGDTVRAVELDDGRPHDCDAAILAVPWKRVGELIDAPLRARLPQVAGLERIESSPITGVHLWLDREVTDLPHAVLVERLSQWVFRHGPRRLGEEAASTAEDPAAHHYQVVISASRELAGRDASDVVAEVLGDLAAVFPAARDAGVISSRVVTQREAVFSVRPGLDSLRPSARTEVPNLLLAGDWTDTGWPATMEGAVRSGYLAAEAVAETFGRPLTAMQPDLPRGWLSRLLLGAC